MEDGQLVQCQCPVPDGHAPAAGSTHERQVDDLAGRSITGEATFGFDGASQHAVDTLDGIRRVDCLANLGSVGEQRNDAFPVGPPAFHDGWVLLAVLAFERIKLSFGLLDAAARVDPLQGAGNALAVRGVFWGVFNLCSEEVRCFRGSVEG